MTLDILNDRRIKLGMSHLSVARRSGVSLPTVHRILSGDHANASLANVEAIASAMGLRLQFDAVKPAEDLREEQARTKARALVGMVQGTSALEGQAIDEQAIESMIRRTVHDLLAGPRRKLWAE